MTADWLLLAYSLPPEPSRKRVAIWRHLRKLGAVYTSEGLWFLPHMESLAASVADVVQEVQHHGGTATAFVATDLRPDQMVRMKERFNQARDDEYSEVRRLCERFIGHVEHATEAQNFSFALVEELEEDLEKRRRRFAQIAQRDAFGSEQRRIVERLLNDGAEALASFTEDVWRRGGEPPGQASS